ncbi:DUF4232 domain-containing protein [Actinoplanes sp. LDG1-06]|uniref:DUF4232 domain-containing protein n=1 Tax=Paractinoplanes ovalisporus TaxID=2810368 RepID=A0ABS2A4B5_9ACTN|nr:DUF4232 domain-containing protein [Actinoplanes ovalisporus]MBM2614681.1 DUF4232 domain-containing protein [Actinoplanes ovalisporus]
MIFSASALLLAGCGSSSSSAPVPGATSSTAAPSSPSPSASASPSPTSAGGGGSSTRCHTADLGITTGEGGAAAGTHSVNLVLTNKSGKTCSLYGYPGVSWVTGDNGTQVNAAFSREAGEAGKTTVSVKPGGKAYVLILWPYYANYDKSECKPVDVRGYRVYPPDETAAIFVADPQTVCSAKGVGAGRVHPVEVNSE